MPGVGHKREDLTDEPLLFWPLKAFTIAYLPQTTPLTIVAIYGGQNPLTFWKGRSRQ